MDQSVAIQETLAKGENCTIAVECVSLLNDVRESKLIGLVQQNNEHALFIYSHRRMAITGDDVTLDEIIPISYDFSVVEVSSPDELAVVGADTRVRVTFFEEKLELKLPFGSHTRLFLSKVNRAWSDVCEQYPKEEPKFDWLTKYRKMTKGARSLRKSTGATTVKMSQMKKSERAHAANNSGPKKEDERTRGDGVHESQERVKSEVRDDLIRNSQPILSNKSQMLGMPQFGLRDNLIKCELLKNEDAYTYIKNYRCGWVPVVLDVNICLLCHTLILTFASAAFQNPPWSHVAYISQYVNRNVIL